jgi:hypothetical protein
MAIEGIVGAAELSRGGSARATMVSGTAEGPRGSCGQHLPTVNAGLACPNRSLTVLRSSRRIDACVCLRSWIRIAGMPTAAPTAETWRKTFAVRHPTAQPLKWSFRRELFMAHLP